MQSIPDFDLSEAAFKDGEITVGNCMTSRNVVDQKKASDTLTFQLQICL